MYSRFAKTLITLTAATAFAVPAGALARNGADDPAGHDATEVHHRSHHQARHHARHRAHSARHGADDGATHARHGADDGPAHT